VDCEGEIGNCVDYVLRGRKANRSILCLTIKPCTMPLCKVPRLNVRSVFINVLYTYLLLYASTGRTAFVHLELVLAKAIQPSVRCCRLPRFFATHLSPPRSYLASSLLRKAYTNPGILLVSGSSLVVFFANPYFTYKLPVRHIRSALAYLLTPHPSPREASLF
jgi:hypothetical protein